MAITLNGTGTIDLGSNGSIANLAVGGVPNGTIDADALAANAVTSGKLASGVGGKVIQVKSTTLTTMVTASSGGSTSYNDIAGFSVDITPATGNRVLVHWIANYSNASDNNDFIKLIRGSTDIYVTTESSLGVGGGSSFPRLPSAWMIYPSVGMHLDLTPGGDGTTTITYKLAWSGEGGTRCLNRRSGNQDVGVASSITVMEVSP